jgi:DMSO/TMAO reductase YedYZ molybdopterin-dependent catalytic subunit
MSIERKAKRVRIFISPWAVVLLIWGCGGRESGRAGTGSVLAAREIRNFQGEKLSSVADFSENSIRGPQRIDAEKYRLRVTGLVETPQTYRYQQLVQERPAYRKVITLDCVEGWKVKILWEGIRLRELLAEARPKASAKVIIFHAHDGYTTSFPVDFIMKNDILLAYRMNGAPLLPERGFPFELAAESRWGYKWIKWVTEIEFSDRADFKGYWERRGYSNGGDRNEDFFEK